jgi:hypothetical protein
MALNTGTYGFSSQRVSVEQPGTHGQQSAGCVHDQYPVSTVWLHMYAISTVTITVGLLSHNFNCAEYCQLSTRLEPTRLAPSIRWIVVGSCASFGTALTSNGQMVVCSVTSGCPTGFTCTGNLLSQSQPGCCPSTGRTEPLERPALLIQVRTPSPHLFLAVRPARACTRRRRNCTRNVSAMSAISLTVQPRIIASAVLR